MHPDFQVDHLVLATLGVALTATITGLAATWLLHTSVETGLLLGAVVASTDAAAVFSVLRKAPLPARLGALIETESGGNDPTAVMLTVGMIAVATGGATAQDWVVFGLRQLVGGLVVGAVVGLLASRLHPNLGARELHRPLVGPHRGSRVLRNRCLGRCVGFLAVYVGGIIVGSVEPAHRQATMAFHDGLARLAQLFIFLLLGLPLPGDARIVAVMRDGRVTVPSGQTVLEAGDRLAIAAPTADPFRDQLSAWAEDFDG